MPEHKQATDILAKINQARSDTSDLRDRWLEFYKLYRNWRDEEQMDGRSNIGIPLAFEWVEVVKSRLFDIFFGKRPYLRVKGREPMDDDSAKGIQHFQNYQYDVADYRKLGYDVLTQALIYGTGIAKVYWKYEEKEKYVDTPIFPEFPEAGTTKQKQKVKTYDNIAFELVDIFDFDIDPEATSIEDARWCSHTVRRSLDYLERMEERGTYKNIGEVREALANEERENGGYEPNQEKQTRSTIEGHKEDRGGLLKPINVREYWEDDKLTTIAFDKIIIREDDNPYRHGRKPYIEAKIISTPHEFYGIGLIEAGAPQAKVMEDLLNSGLDSLNFSINPMIGVDQNRIDDTELVSRPGGIIHGIGDPATSIKPIIIPDVSTNALTWFQLANELAKRGTGVNDYMLGQGGAGKTATEASLMTNEAAKRIGLHVKVLGITFIGKLAKMVHDLNSQFVTDEQFVRVSNMQDNPYGIMSVTPDVFSAEIDFIWESEDREMNNMMAVQQLTQLLSFASTSPILMSFAPIIFEKILAKYDLHENDELMIAAQLAKASVPMMQQVMMMQAQGQGQGGSGAGANAAKVASGSEGNVSQSMNNKTNPQYGSVANVGG